VTSGEGIPEKNAKWVASQVGWILLICGTLYACYFSRLGAIGFLGPDEPRYASVAREMVESGDWITPRLYGRPWFEKPPLYYWGAALSFKLFGVSEAAARLPSAVSALLATLALAWLAWRLYGAETARWLLVVLPTTVAMIGFSHAAAPDMPFAGMLTVAMVCATVLLCMMPHVTPESFWSSPSLSSLNLISLAPLISGLFGIFLGLAVLGKGPAGIILCGGTVLFWALFTKCWHHVLRLFHPAAIGAFGIVTLPWYVLCARRNPDFFRVFIIEHNFKRYLTPEFQHSQPFWYYVPILLLALLPWTLLLLPAAKELARSFRDRFQRGADDLFVAAWAVFPCLFFSFSQSKLPGYILPSIPPLMLLCSAASRKLLAANSWLARLAFAGSSVIAVITIAIGFLQTVRLRGLYRLLAMGEVAPGRLLLFAVGLLTGVIALWFILRRHPQATLICIVFAVVASLWSASLTGVDAALSPRQTAQAIAKISQPDEEVSLCEVPRSYIYGFNFYLHREISEWKEEAPEKHAIVVIGSPACWSELKGRNYRVRTDLDFARWPVIEVEGPSAADFPARGGSLNKK
jgi:4-amino-4-deoxy-L-arabinose transferase-like glycosyltransferase